MQRTWGVGVVALLAITASCGGDDDTGGEAGTAETAVATTTDAVATSAEAATTVAPETTSPETTAPPSTAPATVATTATTEPPGPTWAAADVEGCMCSDGTPATIFERVADPTKVVLYFEGGGACFNAATCDPNGAPTYTVNQVGVTARNLERLGGYFDTDNPENPLAEHSIVYVPYCTGDVHIGNATTDYGDGVVVEHKGHENALKALDYLVATYPDAEQLVVTGESAGSVPTPQFAALAADLLPNADIVTFGDSSGAYPDVDGISGVIGSVWGTMNALPDWPELAGIANSDWSFPEQYIYAGQHAPNVRFGRFDHAFDEVQVTYGQLAGVPPDELVSLIDENEARIEAAGVDLATYVAPGSDHTVSSTSALYEIEVEGVRLIDWLTALINDAEPPADVHCTTCTG
jgi:hypothetical protein